MREKRGEPQGSPLAEQVDRLASGSSPLRKNYFETNMGLSKQESPPRTASNPPPRRITRESNEYIRKPATRVFQHFSFRRSDHAKPMRRSVGTRPRSETTRSRGRNWKNAIRVDSRLFAVRFLIVPHQANSFFVDILDYSRWNSHSSTPGKILFCRYSRLFAVEFSCFHTRQTPFS